jgi:hypothetical protein
MPFAELSLIPSIPLNMVLAVCSSTPLSIRSDNLMIPLAVPARIDQGSRRSDHEAQYEKDEMNVSDAVKINVFNYCKKL